MSCAVCFANWSAVSFAQIPEWPGIHAKCTETFMPNNSSCNAINFFNHSSFLQYSLASITKFTACKLSHKTKRRSGKLLFVLDLQYCVRMPPRQKCHVDAITAAAVNHSAFPRADYHLSVCRTAILAVSIISCIEEWDAGNMPTQCSSPRLSIKFSLYSFTV